MFNRKTTPTLAAAALAAVLAAVAVGPSARASTLPLSSCGEVVLASVILTKDLDCLGYGIRVAGSGITIDLNGHVLKGAGGLSGVDIGSHDNTTVKNGVIRNFGTGVDTFTGADHVTVASVVAAGNVNQGINITGDSASIKSSTASGNGQNGIAIFGGSASIQSSSVASNGGMGIGVAGDGASIKSSSALANTGSGFVLLGDSASVASSTASGNGIDGLYVAGDQASIKSINASGNVNYGLLVAGDAATLKGNRADGNGFAFPSGGSDGIGLGILVNGFTTPPLGTNLAGGNDDPAQCQPSSLCPTPAGKSAKAGWTPITTCAQSVITNAVLTKDLACAGIGIVVAASGISIDLDGHVLKGSNNGWAAGIDAGFGADDVTVENGVVRNFDVGILVCCGAIGANGVTISDVVVSGNTKQGISISGDSASIKSSTVAGNGGDGIAMFGDEGATQSSTVAGNGGNGVSVLGKAALVKSSSAFGNALNGIFLKGSGDLRSVVSSTASGNGLSGVRVDGGQHVSIKSTTASGNAGYGLWVIGDAATLERNRADGNGFAGAVSDGIGLGIRADYPTTPPVGTNLAGGNDDPADCGPASLC